MEVTHCLTLLIELIVIVVELPVREAFSCFDHALFHKRCILAILIGQVHSGFAFGFGIERVTLLRAGITYCFRLDRFKVHTVLFFIGIVANCGGLLTPLGDPPVLT